MTSIRATSDLGALIRERRRARGLGQAGLAELAGVSRLWIIEIERGKEGAEVGLVLRTLAALDLRLSIDEATGTKSADPVSVPDIDAVIRRARKSTRGAKRT